MRLEPAGYKLYVYVIIYGLVLAYLATFVWFLFNSEQIAQFGFAPFMGTAIAIAVILSLAVLDLKKAKFYMEGNTIYLQSIFGLKTRNLGEVVKFKEMDGFLVLYFKENKKLKVSSTFVNFNEFSHFISDNFYSNEEFKHREAIEDLIEHETEEFDDLAGSIMKAKSIAKFYNAFVLLLLLIAFFYAPMRGFIFTVLLTIPLFIFVTPFFFKKGMFRMDLAEGESRYFGHLFWPLLMCVAGILFLGPKFNMIETINFNINVLCIGFLLGLIFVFRNTKPNWKSIEYYAIWFLCLLCTTGYAFFLIQFINCENDTSVIASKPIVLVEKQEVKSSRYSKEYNYKMYPFENDTLHYQVAKSKYDLHKEGDTLKVIVHEGNIGFQWIEIEEFKMSSY